MSRKQWYLERHVDCKADYHPKLIPEMVRNFQARAPLLRYEPSICE